MILDRFDQDYVNRLRAGHLDTQRHFTRYFGELLDIKLRSRLRSPQLAEEVRQETFLRVLIALRRDSIEHPERLGAFVNATCNNVLFEVFRNESRWRPATGELPDPVDQHDGPEISLVNKQRQGEVRKILAEMPEKDRKLLRLLFLEEKDKDEICKTFCVDRDYLRVLLHRAKNRFRAVLEQSQSATGAKGRVAHGGEGAGRGS